MTYTTELLENESGIQYQGVKDKSGGTGTYPITGLMTGIFKRGRFDKPMTITNENIRAQLGYDPKNSYYVAVQDALSSGVPSVQVLRLNGEDIEPEIPTEPEITYRLTIDDKGLLPEDNIYSGTIEPPLIGAVLSFNIQQFLPNGSNGRVFNIYSDPQGLVVSPNGATWKVDKSTVASSWDFPTASDFITPATYSLSINKMYGDKNVIGVNLEYTVAKPENWDIKYKVNGQWVYETTGPIVEISNDRNNTYRNSATELVFNNTVTEVGYGAFSFWVSLTKLTLGENITAIRARAFSSLKSVLELTIPDSVEFIGNEAFRSAEKVKNITLGTGVTTIESYAFTESFVLDAFIMTGLTPPLVMQYPMLIMSSGSNGYTTGVIFVPDEAYDAYVAAQLPRLRRLSALSTYDFTEPYHWTN